MKEKNRILEIAPKHVIPDELSTLSLYEILCYLSILFLVSILYVKWTDIGILHQDVYVENLSFKDSSNFGVILDYDIPVSSVYHDDAELRYTSFLGGSCRNASSKTVSYIDSLKNDYTRTIPESNTRTDYSLMYLRSDTPAHRDDQGKFIPFRMEKKAGVYAITKTSLSGEKKPVLFAEAYVPVFDYASSSNTLSFKSNPLFTEPKFFSRRDISQVYYEIDIHTNTIDSVIFNLRFTGAVEIIPAGEKKPILNEGNYLSYGINSYSAFSETIVPIRFYVKFKDLENKQSRRVFLVSSVLGGLVMLFVAFLVIFLFRLGRVIWHYRHMAVSVVVNVLTRAIQLFKRFWIVVLVLSIVIGSVCIVTSKTHSRQKRLEQAQELLDQGHYQEAAIIARNLLRRSGKVNPKSRLNVSASLLYQSAASHLIGSSYPFSYTAFKSFKDAPYYWADSPTHGQCIFNNDGDSLFPMSSQYKVEEMIISPDFRWLRNPIDWKEAELIDLSNGKHTQKLNDGFFKGHSFFSQDSRWFWNRANTRSAILIDLSGKLMAIDTVDQYANDAIISNDGRWLWHRITKEQAVLTDLTTRTTIDSLDYYDGKALFSPDSRWLWHRVSSDRAVLTDLSKKTTTDTLDYYDGEALFSSDSRWLWHRISFDRAVLTDLSKRTTTDTLDCCLGKAQFSPDSRWLWYRTDFERATLYNLNDKRLVYLNDYAEGPNFSPNSRWLCYKSVIGATALLYLPDKGYSKSLSPLLYYDELPEFSPDSRWMIFRSAKDSLSLVYLNRHKMHRPITLDMQSAIGLDSKTLYDSTHNALYFFTPQKRQIGAIDEALAKFKTLD